MNQRRFTSLLLTAPLMAGSCWLGHALASRAEGAPAAAPMAQQTVPPQEVWTKVLTAEDGSHTPLIKVPAKIKAGEMFPVEVQVGKLKLHPTLPWHHVEWVELYVDETEIAHVQLGPVFISPKFTFYVTLQKSATLKVREMPNHSAPWESSQAVTIQ